VKVVKAEICEVSSREYPTSRHLSGLNRPQYLITHTAIHEQFKSINLKPEEFQIYDVWKQQEIVHLKVYAPHGDLSGHPIYEG
jgi:hypothetical protein